jgi:hypothetical protein
MIGAAINGTGSLRVRASGVSSSMVSIGISCRRRSLNENPIRSSTRLLSSEWEASARRPLRCSRRATACTPDLGGRLLRLV